ncbi:MAG: glycine zipper domain-containing protein [Thermodesulfobacteriota bacterium]|nr:glycine zipper domain-containing protein [Thermodesulfobacteriota bacterium]
MKHYRKVLFGCLIISCVTVAPSIGGTIVYPTQGQSQEQQTKDEGECRLWATEKTGVDPLQVAKTASSQSAPQQEGKVVKGAAGGALAGLAVGAIAGDAGKGAAIGATAGGIGGGVRKHQQQKAQQSSAQQTQAQQKANLDQYEKAYRACMTGRDYSIQ